MAEQGGQEKTENATPKKREDSRREGMVAYSKEASSAVLMGTFLLYFLLFGRATVEQLMIMMRHAFQNLIIEDITISSLRLQILGDTWPVALALMGMFLAVLLIGFMASAMQVGLMANPLQLKWERLDPIQGMQRIFSAQGLADLLKSIFKMGVIGYITYLTLSEEMVDMFSLSKMPLGGILEFNVDLLVSLITRVTVAMVILGIFDYLFQRWNYEQKIMMTKQEMKEEHKQTEGDPQLRARVRQIQKEISRARMMQNVPKSDVVVTNPTHYAVALMYDREIMDAPRVMAKGADFVAMRIREVAEENNVPIVENPPVARELYGNVEIGEQVPESLFKAVAEILAYV
ncbi:MAG: flagellar biosynthesis protein FlhB, partial [Deltaproteobacteria bacterium]|nr:flagellar biosynthesis protein FlhB [Deltaproteobacteria bacterium]